MPMWNQQRLRGPGIEPTRLLAIVVKVATALRGAQWPDRRWGWKPTPILIGEVNRRLKSWASYFQFGYPSRAFEKINEYVEMRLRQHLRRRSQRPFRTLEGVRDGVHLQRLGLALLRRSSAKLPAKA